MRPGVGRRRRCVDCRIGVGCRTGIDCRTSVGCRTGIDCRTGVGWLIGVGCRAGVGCRTGVGGREHELSIVGRRLANCGYRWDGEITRPAVFDVSTCVG